jgi:hypothetical protein
MTTAGQHGLRVKPAMTQREGCHPGLEEPAPDLIRGDPWIASQARNDNRGAAWIAGPGRNNTPNKKGPLERPLHIR